MKSRSGKNKGRRACLETREILLKYYPQLQEKDIVIMPTSVIGEDVKFSPLAESLIPYSIENKNVEKLNIHKAYEQAVANAPPGRIPVVVYRKNHTNLKITIDFETFLQLTTQKDTKIQE